MPDHGLLLGTRDDDHPQYYNAARLSSWWSGRPPNAHSHVVADITDIGTYYSAVGHSHVEADITDLQSYALSTHNHDGVYAPTHSHPYAATSHDHTESDITDLGNYSVVGHTHSYLPLSGGTISGSLTVTGTMDINEIYGDLGSVSDPSFTFDGQTTSGMYYAAGVALTVAGTQRFKADASGAVVSGRLDVTSYVYAASFQDSGYSTVASPGWKVWGQSSGLYITAAAPNGFTGLSYGGATVIAGNGSNQVYLGGMTSNAGSGTLRYIGTQIYYFASSERFKHDIESAHVDPSVLLRFPPSWFRFNDNPERRNLGWIAEHLYDIGGDLLVTRDETGRIQGNDEDAIRVLVVELLKEHEDRIRRLERRAA